MPGTAGVWDVVRVDFPYADSDGTTGRPAPVAAAPAATHSYAILWVLMITSARHTPWPNDVSVSDLRSAGLSHPSIVRTAKIAAIDTRLANTIGCLSEPDREAVRRCLRQHIGSVLAS